MTEKWKVIKDYPNYQISNEGRVRGVKKILKTTINNDNRLMIMLKNESGAKRFSVHRLVAQAFIPNPFGLPEVHHKDKDCTNNIASNLEWLSSQEHRQKHLGDAKAPRHSAVLDERQLARKAKRQASNREWYLRNRDKRLAYSKQYYQDNIEQERATRLKRWQEGPKWQGQVYKKIRKDT